ncbi:LOW QUALITY PROTEIN: hypothetical protein MAR_027958, partial [Mya arenaria]
YRCGLDCHIIESGVVASDADCRQTSFIGKVMKHEVNATKAGMREEGFRHQTLVAGGLFSLFLAQLIRPCRCQVVRACNRNKRAVVA